MRYPVRAAPHTNNGTAVTLPRLAVARPQAPQEAGQAGREGRARGRAPRLAPPALDARAGESLRARAMHVVTIRAGWCGRTAVGRGAPPTVSLV